MEKAVCYIRCGPDEDRDGPDVASQQKAMEAYCQERAFDIVTVVKDEAVPGTQPLDERLGGNDLASIVESTGVPNIVCLKLDRLFRNAIDAHHYVTDWINREIVLHVVDVGGTAASTGGEEGPFFLSMISGFADLEKKTASERTRSAIAVKKANRFVYGTTPYGYDQDGNQLTPNEKEQKILESVRKWHEKGWSLRKIANKLNDRKIPTKKSGRRSGATKWYASTVRYLLTNPLYAPAENDAEAGIAGQAE